MPSLLMEAEADRATANIQLGAWTCIARQPGSVTHPDQLGEQSAWLKATAPGTVASALDAAGLWDFEHPTDLDASDWWFRTSFATPNRAFDQLCRLCFDGLATLAEVWLNGQRILTSDNMFRSYRVDVAPFLQADNELVIGFRSLTDELKRKRPRPKWKTNLVRNQQLRWIRTALIGRIPGWSPCAPTMGPWRSIRLEASPVLLDDLHIVSTLCGDTGIVTLRARIAAAAEPQRAILRVGSIDAELSWIATDDGWQISGEVQVENAPKWWPHTHGTPTLLNCELIVETTDGAHRFSMAPIGFRKLEVQTDDRFSVLINDVPVYCRGACWTVSDLLSPDSNETTLRRDLQLAKAAGANMLRVGGTMNYESEAFYRICDELGLLVWQDFMFANMDYPVEDAAFSANITAEATEQLKRLSPHPSVVIYCGNSEIEQQAAMLGLPRERWTHDWFSGRLPELCATLHPGAAYVPSSPTGGALPFHTNTGITHYYGVGAYLRSPSELRQADVKFSPECLGFANVPEPSTIFAVTGGSHPVMHDPTWKSRVPRDGGAGWDFEDVRDHYLRQIYGVDPVQLRSFDMPRYLELSRAVSGEMMARVFSEWRSTHSSNRGGLVWFYKDIWPGAGWGIIDSPGLPKAAYYFLKRSWQSRQLTMTDEGLNGLDLHLSNETALPCTGTLAIVLLKEPNIIVARQEMAITLDARSQRRVSADELLGRFYDPTYAYRFGPPQHDAAITTWFDEDRQVISEAFHFVNRMTAGKATTHSVTACAEKASDEAYRVTISADRFLHTVRLEAEGFLPDDNYFHLVPNRSKIVMFRRSSESQLAFRANLQALNLDSELTITISKSNA